MTKIHSCVDQAGNLKIVGASDTCKKNETALDWSVQGVKGDKGVPGLPGAKGDPGPPGTFTGTFTSPNQDYSLTVTDNGIELAGPTSLVRLGATSLEVISDVPVLIENASTIDIKATSVLTLKGSVVNIN